MLHTKHPVILEKVKIFYEWQNDPAETGPLGTKFFSKRTLAGRFAVCCKKSSISKAFSRLRRAGYAVLMTWSRDEGCWRYGVLPPAGPKPETTCTKRRKPSVVAPRAARPGRASAKTSKRRR